MVRGVVKNDSARRHMNLVRAHSRCARALVISVSSPRLLGLTPRGTPGFRVNDCVYCKLCQREGQWDDVHGCAEVNELRL